MFDMKSMGKIANLIKNRDKIESAARDVKAHLDTLRVEGQSGSGAVRVTVTGAMKVESVRIDPALAAGLVSNDKAMAEGLITHAVNDAMNKAQEAARVAIQQKMGELGLGDLGDLDALNSLQKMLP